MTESNEIEMIGQSRATTGTTGTTGSRATTGTAGTTGTTGSRATTGTTGTAGNTEKQSLQKDYWCFTYNNYTIEKIEQLVQIFSHECDWYIFQEENGEETGTPHLQGTLKLKKRQRMTALKKWNVKISWKPTKSVSASMTYCTKEKTRTGRQWVHGIKIPEKEITLWQKWQFEIEEICKTEPDDRTIHWYWEPIGKTGKTTLARYLTRKYRAIPLEGKKNDVLYCAAQHESEIYIYDLERTMENYISYGSIEKIKNGYYMCSKYKSKPIDRNPPHVFVFANFPPDKTALSEDRWHIVKIQT
jgi:hypothetical protein